MAGSPGKPTRSGGVFALVVLLLVACAPGTPGTTPGIPSAPSSDSSTARESEASASQPHSPDPAPSRRTPLVLAVHHSRTPSDIAPDTARAVVDAGQVAWAELALPGGVAEVVRADSPEETRAAVNRVAADPNLIAVVPATAIDERVRVLTVGGVHPLREPAAYPLTVPRTAPPPKVTTVTIVGDIMMGRRVGSAHAGDLEAPFRPYAERLASADITLGNFESTLSRNGQPTQGGDSFAADPRSLAGLRLSGFDAISLANNHLGDFGPTAMQDTFVELEEAGLPWFGAGRDLAAAGAPLVIERDGVRVAFIGTESIGETPAATSDSGGTNRLNMPPRTGRLDTTALDRIAAQITEVAQEVDTVIVVPHWGRQYTHVPEESQRLVAKRFATAGADLIVGGHPHWVQGWEIHGDTTVVHSLGNFIFDMTFSRQVQEGVFVEVVLWDGQVKAIEPVPYVIEQSVPRPAGPERASRILADLRSTSTGPYAG